MDRNQAKEFYPIMQAFAEGKVIECRTEPSFIEGSDVPNDWTEMKEIEFWKHTEYRIKPEQKYRPFKSAEECWQEMLKHQPFGWLKNGNCYYNVVSISNMDANIISLSDVVATLCFSDFIKKNYIFADGVSFGVKEEE